MRIDVVTLFPDLVAAVGHCGITGRAVERGLLSITCWNPRDYTTDRHRTVDDRPFGGGPGMVMRVEPLRSAIDAARAARSGPARLIYLSPAGRRLDQGVIGDLGQEARLILVAGRYEGIDERLLAIEPGEEWSIGDYVLSGGELPAMVLIDALARLMPGALGDATSVECESHMRGLLDCPHYTRPREIEGLAVPEVLLDGDHAAIARWREKQSLGRTWLRRPDLIAATKLDERQRGLLDEFICERNATAESATRDGELT